MPARDFLGMRGVAHGLTESASDAQILARCKARLEQRGVVDPRISLVELDGKPPRAVAKHVSQYDAEYLARALNDWLGFDHTPAAPTPVSA